MLRNGAEGAQAGNLESFAAGRLQPRFKLAVLVDDLAVERPLLLLPSLLVVRGSLCRGKAAKRDEARLWSAALQVGAAAAGGLWHRRLPSLRAWRPTLVI